MAKHIEIYLQKKQTSQHKIALFNNFIIKKSNKRQKTLQKLSLNLIQRSCSILNLSQGFYLKQIHPVQVKE